VQQLADTFRLSLGADGALEGAGISIVKLRASDEGDSPAGLSFIRYDGHIYCFVPADVELPAIMESPDGTELPGLRSCAYPGVTDSAALAYGTAHIDPDKWPGEKTIVSSLRDHQRRQYLRDVLAKARGPQGVYAGAANVTDETPQLVEGLWPDGGVAVVYGRFDELKSTLIGGDFAGAVAGGTTFLGRRVPKPRIVFLYTLEGKEEAPGRLRAVNAKFQRNGGTIWGDDHLPVSLFDSIPESDVAWRQQIVRKMGEWSDIYEARNQFGEFTAVRPNGHNRLAPSEVDGDVTEFSSVEEVPADYLGYFKVPEDDMVRRRAFDPIYDADICSNPPLIIIDTLSMWLGGDAETGSAAPAAINRCLNLLKEASFKEPDDFEGDTEADRRKAWEKEYGCKYFDTYLNDPVASAIVIVHHTTKAGDDFGGHRAIGANTQALYRIHRFGRMTDADRPYSGQLTPLRTKGMARPAAVRFEAEVVPVPGTTDRTTVILKDKSATVPDYLAPAVDALRDLPDHQEISVSDVNQCLDVVAAEGEKAAGAVYVARHRYRKKMEDAGILEPVEDDDGKLLHYVFHDPS
jgi:hypothetical protein